VAEATVFQQIFDYANRADPYPLYAELRKTPVARQPDGAYVVSTYWEIVALLHDPRISSALQAPAGATTQQTATGSVQVSSGAAGGNGFILTDPPLHDRLRRLAMRYFGPPDAPERVDGMRPGLGDLAGALVDKLKDKQQIDIVDDFAYPLPVTAICRLLGVPPEDETRFHAWADAIVDGLDVGFETDPAEAQRRGALAYQATVELSQYMGGMIERYRSQPADNFLSGLVTDNGPEGRMTDEQLLATANLLLLAGHETTVNLITNGMLTFLRYPEILERLRREPGLIVRTVEELLRFEPSVHLLPNRSALTDIAIGGTTIPKGSPITLVLAAGNRDPLRFPDPDRFDPDRADNQHLGFGSGIHACFGAPLARLEAQLALTELVQRLENPRLAADPPPYRHSPILRGPRHLAVAVDDIRPA
jgi:cytochrome P450